MKKRIQTGDAPAAIGPYSQAVRAGTMVFCSGQIGLDPATGQVVEGGVEAQTVRALDNLRGVLKEAGLTLDNVVRTTIFLADLNDFATVNEIYGRYFSEPFPSRSTVGVAALPRGGRVEIDAIAVAE